MASLPPELIEHICSLLCSHCQQPGVFPDSDLNDFRLSQKALAHLSRVSRRFCAVAQPFLFHQYSTGNLPPQHDSSARGKGQSLPREDDKLPAFLRSLTTRPDLATHIRTLQLVETDETSGLTPELATVLFEASRQIGASRHVPTLEYLETTLWRHSRQTNGQQRIQRRKVHHWLEELAILLTPKVEILHIARDSFCQYEHVRDSGASLPALKLIHLRAISRNQHVHEGAALFNAAPNLRTLHSMQCSMFDDLNPWSVSKPWALNLKSLERLVLSEIGFRDLALLIACCPRLRELEVTAINIHRTAGYDHWDVSKLLQTLDPVRHQLRKLRLTHSPSQRSGADQRLTMSNTSSWSFRDFVQLEELVVDQGTIKGWPGSLQTDDEASPEHSLIEMLPPSITVLRLLYVEQDFMSELKRLAQESAYWLPSLKLVQVSFLDRVDKRDVEFKYMKDIAPSLLEAGIEVHWDTSQVDDMPLTMAHKSVTRSKPGQLSPLASAVLGIERMAL